MPLSLIAAALLLAAGAQEKPGAPKQDPKAALREQKAEELWTQAGALENSSRFIDAQLKLRELRSRYRGTLFYFSKLIEISDKINALGLKVAVASLQKTALYKRPHQDSWFSYEFAPPEGWKGIPPQAKWFNDFDNSEVDYQGQIERISRYTAPYLDKLSLQVYKVYASPSAEYLENKVVSQLEMSYAKLTVEAKSVVPAARGTCQRRVYSSADGDRLVAYYFYDGKRALALVGAWRSGSEDGGFISITSVGPGGLRTVKKTSDAPLSQEDFGHALKIFDSCAKTFWIYDAGTRQGMSIKLDRSALCSDWQQLRSAKGGYLIEYATSPEYAKKCGEELEQILTLYRQVLPTAKAVSQCRVKVFDRQEDFLYYGGAYGAAAYWSPGQEEIVCYKFEGDKVRFDSAEEFEVADDRAPEEVTFKILYHEAFHQYMFYAMGRGRRVYVPSWLNEGLGDYFFGGEWQKSPRKFSIGINDWRIATIAKAVKDNKHVPIEQIIRYEQMQYYKTAGLCYAQGWAMNYFFLTSPVAKSKGYHLLPQRMLEGLKTSGDWEKATDKAFAGIDLKKMEEEWKAFVLAIPIPKHLQERMKAMEDEK